MTPGYGLHIGAAATVKSGLPYTETTGADLFSNGRSNARPVGVPRNSLQGDGSAVIDMCVSRDFRLHGSASSSTLSLGVDAFNLLNTVNYRSYVGAISSPLFMQPVSARPARQLQLSAR